LTSSYTAVASDTNGRWATNTVNVDLAASVPFQYDLNGNLTNDGLRSFAYDDENQLIQVWVPGEWSSVFTYDGKMRRRIRQEFTWQGGAWVQTNAVYYVYDGNLVIQERDVNNLPTTTYTRGKDLSGSLAGAGGIGGLLARTAQAYVDAPLAGHAFYHADGNGNVTRLIDSSQAVVAKYLYDAFGNVLSASGLLADANRCQSSGKEKDLNSGLVYYLYRFYDPNLQRWPNRDPIGELGGFNLYGFVGNNSIDKADLFGFCFMPPKNPGNGPWNEADTEIALSPAIFGGFALADIAAMGAAVDLAADSAGDALADAITDYNAATDTAADASNVAAQAEAGSDAAVAASQAEADAITAQRAAGDSLVYATSQSEFWTSVSTAWQQTFW
jgi:RHS repeat-associated protein